MQYFRAIKMYVIKLGSFVTKVELEKCEFQKIFAARNTVCSKIDIRWVLPYSRSVRNFSGGKEKSSLVLYDVIRSQHP